ncbi:hypothetical protein NIES30_06310 [Phormidium tenue NIES-30]|uniref:Uncharacterized protein n=1 Tax=Phormidium tenue NIES-30 TaxID=549789 RepID=A0A1U7J879_9CYAN|nr:hypothetical protein NIES30_06310 [Phormidium tenue NIES-30]
MKRNSGRRDNLEETTGGTERVLEVAVTLPDLTAGRLWEELPRGDLTLKLYMADAAQSTGAIALI